MGSWRSSSSWPKRTHDGRQPGEDRASGRRQPARVIPNPDKRSVDPCPRGGEADLSPSPSPAHLLAHPLTRLRLAGAQRGEPYTPAGTHQASARIPYQADRPIARPVVAPTWSRRTWRATRTVSDEDRVDGGIDAHPLSLCRSGEGGVQGAGSTEHAPITGPVRVAGERDGLRGLDRDREPAAGRLGGNGERIVAPVHRSEAAREVGIASDVATLVGGDGDLAPTSGRSRSPRSMFDRVRGRTIGWQRCVRTDR